MPHPPPLACTTAAPASPPAAAAPAPPAADANAAATPTSPLSRAAAPAPAPAAPAAPPPSTASCAAACMAAAAPARARRRAAPASRAARTIHGDYGAEKRAFNRHHVTFMRRGRLQPERDAMLPGLPAARVRRSHGAAGAGACCRRPARHAASPGRRTAPCCGRRRRPWRHGSRPSHWPGRPGGRTAPRAPLCAARWRSAGKTPCTRTGSGRGCRGLAGVACGPVAARPKAHAPIRPAPSPAASPQAAGDHRRANAGKTPCTKSRRAPREQGLGAGRGSGAVRGPCTRTSGGRGCHRPGGRA